MGKCGAAVAVVMWESRAFEPPLYCVVHVLHGNARGGWALDLTHHKLGGGWHP